MCLSLLDTIILLNRTHSINWDFVFQFIILLPSVSLSFDVGDGVPGVAKIVLSFTGTEDITVSNLFVVACAKSEGKC